MLFFIIWGWQHRAERLGFAGPYTCPTCSWAGSFWLDRLERRLRIYFIPVTRWRVTRYLCVCRHCGSAIPLSPEKGEELISDIRPLNAPDPFGPAPASQAPATTPVGARDPSVEVDDDSRWQQFVNGDNSR